MKNCNHCSTLIKQGNQLVCPSCQTTFCIECADKTKRICPKCYHNLEFNG